MPTETTMEMETTETTTVEMTTESTTTTTLPPKILPKSTGGSRPQPPVLPGGTVFPGTNTTSIDGRSAGNATSKGTAGAVPSSPAIPHANATSNSSSWIPKYGTNSSSAAPTAVGGSAKGNGSTSAQVFPTRITSEGSTAPRQTPTREGPTENKNTAQLPAAVRLLVRVPLSFRIINRSFNESLRDPGSEEYRSLSRAVLAVVSPTLRQHRGRAGEEPPHLGAFPGSAPSICSGVETAKGGGCGEVAVTSMLPSSSSTFLAARVAWARRATPAAASCATGEYLAGAAECSPSGGDPGADGSSRAAQARCGSSPASCSGMEAMPALPTPPSSA